MGLKIAHPFPVNECKSHTIYRETLSGYASHHDVQDGCVESDIEEKPTVDECAGLRVPGVQVAVRRVLVHQVRADCPTENTSRYK